MSERQPIDLDDLQRVAVKVRELTDDNWLADMVEIACAEIARLREGRKPVAWCVQAAAGSMVHAGTHSPICAPLLIQATDLPHARMMAAVYGHKILEIVEPDEKEVPRG